ncbi:MAG: hypothetical protein WD558_01290, partial [Pseudomonadales bacterium]
MNFFKRLFSSPDDETQNKPDDAARLPPELQRDKATALQVKNKVVPEDRLPPDFAELHLPDELNRAILE